MSATNNRRLTVITGYDFGKLRLGVYLTRAATVDYRMRIIKPTIGLNHTVDAFKEG
jgi:hypothetical protein